jgi:integrase/recombinase XerD
MRRQNNGLPKYCSETLDRKDGTWRVRFRRRGVSKYLTGMPWSEAFMKQYHEALGSTRQMIGVSRTLPGSINELCLRYYASDAFKEGFAVETQKMRRAILERLRAEYGEQPVREMQQRHVYTLLEGMKPFAKRNWLKTLRGLMLFAITQRMRHDDPTRDVKLTKPPRSEGFLAWKPQQVEQYRAQHPLGTTARLALELLLNIAARRYDAHVIGPQHVVISNRDGQKKLCWRPHKTTRTTGRLLKVPITSQLQQALDAMPARDGETLAFLTTDHGKPFASAAAFGNKFAQWCDEAGLQPVRCEDGIVRNYRAHGLRKAALQALAHAGCTGVELMAVSGHASLVQLQAYLQEVEQEDMATAAITKLNRAETRT